MKCWDYTSPPDLVAEGLWTNAERQAWIAKRSETKALVDVEWDLRNYEHELWDFCRWGNYAASSDFTEWLVVCMNRALAVNHFDAEEYTDGDWNDHRQSLHDRFVADLYDEAVWGADAHIQLTNLFVLWLTTLTPHRIFEIKQKVEQSVMEDAKAMTLLVVGGYDDLSNVQKDSKVFLDRTIKKLQAEWAASTDTGLVIKEHEDIKQAEARQMAETRAAFCLPPV